MAHRGLATSPTLFTSLNKLNLMLPEFQQEIRRCRRCLISGYDVAPGPVFSCGSTPQVMVIGQAPGVTEVEAKRPFNASSGRRLFEWLEIAGWDEVEFRATHYMTSVTKCYPGKDAKGKGDRVPSKIEQQLCRPFLNQEIELVNPKLILLVGKLAIRLIYPTRFDLNDIVGTALYFSPEVLASDEPHFHFKRGTMTQLFQGQPAGRFIVPLPHPSGASLWPNHPENKAQIQQALLLLKTIKEGWQL